MAPYCFRRSNEVRGLRSKSILLNAMFMALLIKQFMSQLGNHTCPATQKATFKSKLLRTGKSYPFSLCLGMVQEGNSIFALDNLGRSVLSHSLVGRTGKLHVASHFPYATDNMVPLWWWENQRTDYFCCNFSTEMLCDTFNFLGKELIEQFLLHC